MQKGELLQGQSPQNVLNGLHMGMKVKEESRGTPQVSVQMEYLNQGKKERAQEANKGTVLVQRNRNPVLFALNDNRESLSSLEEER